MPRSKSHKKGRRPRTKQSFNAVYRKTDRWWVAYVEELPGANTQGKTKAEAKRNLQDAVRMLIAANRELAKQELEGAEVLKEKLTVAI